MKKVQVAQNRLLRLLEGCKIKDKVSIKTMLANHNLPSINQLAVEVKLIEAWKVVQIDNYPTKMYPGNRTINSGNSDRNLRANPKRELKDFAKSKIGENSFCIDAGRIWNKTPMNIRTSMNINEAKRLIKIYSKTMPV